MRMASIEAQSQQFVWSQPTANRTVEQTHNNLIANDIKSMVRNHLIKNQETTTHSNRAKHRKQIAKTAFNSYENLLLSKGAKLAANMKPVRYNETTTHLMSYNNQQQDNGKRALIKNQLHLIEQLQLENANLRNERDQLQLENEELKFQLQMISSSNILAQSSTALDERQLDKYVSDSVKTSSPSASSSNEDFHSTTANSTSNILESFPDGLNAATASQQQQSRSSSTNINRASGCCDSEILLVGAAPNVPRCTTTPLRYPVKSSTTLNLNAQKSQVGIIESGNGRISASHYNLQALQQEAKSSSRQVHLTTTTLSCKRTDQPTADPFYGFTSTATRQQTTTTNEAASQQHLTGGSNATASANLNRATSNSTANKFLNVKSTSLSSFVDVQHKQNLGNLIMPAAILNSQASDIGHDDEDQRAKLVEQRYGGDSGHVQAAALIIQRAFRRHQICKRFRMITEQLRHACQPSAATTTTNNQIITSSSSVSSSHKLTNPVGTPTATTSCTYEGNLVIHQQSDDDINLARLSRDEIVLRESLCGRSSHPNQQQQQPTTGMFVIGATRTAAWESLSYAASRLAASAANSLSNNNSNNSNNVRQIIRSSSNTNVAESTVTTAATNSTTKLASNHMSDKATPTITTSTATTSSLVRPQNQQQHELKQRSALRPSNPVVAAAINFQQLESIRKRQYRVGLNIFNKHPEKGISFLIAHSFIASSSPYTTKSTPSYYLSNQIHFIDSKQTSLAHQPSSDSTTITPSATASCQACYEEDSLKCNVAHFLLNRKGLAKEKIGQYLGNLQSKFNQDVLNYYLQELDFAGLQIDVALRKFSATLRLPGEAQKIERMVDCFAQRYVQCQQQQSIGRDNNISLIQLSSSNTNSSNNNQNNNTPTTQQLPTLGNLFKLGSQQQKPQQHNLSNYKNNLTLLTRDEIFILTFAIIMLNTDLHSPSLKTTSRMSALQFVNNLRGVFKSQNINESDLIEIYERVKADQIATTPDHLTHVMRVQQSLTIANNQKKELPNLCVPHRRLVCSCRLFEVYDINKKERVGQHQREVFLFNDMLLITKLARRARANSAQQFAFRQSIPLKGLQVQLFQSTHYNYGIRLCIRSKDETIIMFNAHNELDQGRFVEDLSESIAETDEMDIIRSQNIIETIHLKHLERLKRHTLSHSEDGLSKTDQNIRQSDLDFSEVMRSKKSCDFSKQINLPEQNGVKITKANRQESRSQVKCSSMSNLSTVVENKEENSFTSDKQNQTLLNNALLHPSEAINDFSRSSNQSSGQNRRSSASSIHSLDSGMFISRDVSPNQSS